MENAEPTTENRTLNDPPHCSVVRGRLSVLHFPHLDKIPLHFPAIARSGKSAGRDQFQDERGQDPADERGRNPLHDVGSVPTATGWHEAQECCGHGHELGSEALDGPSMMAACKSARLRRRPARFGLLVGQVQVQEHKDPSLGVNPNNAMRPTQTPMLMLYRGDRGTRRHRPPKNARQGDDAGLRHRPGVQ